MAAANGPVAREAVRERAEAALRRHVPGARIGAARLDGGLRLVLGPILVPGADGGPSLAQAEEALVTLRWSGLLGGRAEPEAIRFRGAAAHAGALKAGPVDGEVRFLPGGTIVSLLPEGGDGIEIRLERTGPRALRAVASLPPGGALEASVAVGEGDDPGLELAVRVEEADWQALLAALPPALRPPPQAPGLAGTFSFRLEAAGPFQRPGEWRLDAALDLSRLRPDGPVRLAGPFDHRTPAFAGASRTIAVGPANPLFVPLGELPRWVPGAVTAAEDAGFFAHRGFDFAEVREALARGIASGRPRGASTLTQQLAKNLFLSEERTLARKVREALCTVALEAALPKRRLLEIYLNTIEWGPGVFGIGEAARHYFGKDARALTPLESAYLASVIPNPVRYHVHFERGAIPGAWDDRVRQLLGRMYSFDQIGVDQFLEAVGSRVEFRNG